MLDRGTTAATVATALVTAGAVLCSGVPAGAVTPAPAVTAGATPAAPASATAAPTTAPAIAPTTTAAPARTPAATAVPAPAPTASRTLRPAARTAVPSAPAPTPAPTTTSPAATAPATTAPAIPVPTAVATGTPTPSPTPTPLVPPPVATALSSASGHAARSRTVTLTGSELTNLLAVRVAGAAAADLVVLSPTTARFTMPNAIDYQARTVPISLTSRSDGITRPTALTFTYVVRGRVGRQMEYAFQNWNAYSNATFGYLSGNDCMNFASQTLLARGWKRGPEWFNSGPGRWSSTWVSSTAFSTWLQKRPDLATRLPYRERDRVVVGDVIQFRWPGHRKGYTAWDHTGIVSKVVVLPDGRHDVYYTSHTLNRQYGGSTQVLARVMAKDLRIQFFSLR